MKYIILLLLTTACSGGVEDLTSASRPDQLEEGLLCGWLPKKVDNLGSTNDPNNCWLLDPPNGVSAMSVGSHPCEADEGTGPRIWPNKADVELFVEPDTSGYISFDPIEVACP